MALKSRSHVNMTEGSVFRHLLAFSLPLLLGNLFQQLYNTVDIWVVGNYVSDAAFSAVGSVSSIVNLLIGSFTGLATGAEVVIAQYYGAAQRQRVRDAAHTAAVMTLILTVFFTLAGVFASPLMLRLMKTPANVFPHSVAYLRIYFGGMAGLLFYNMGAGILRAVGDSRRPFYYLVIASMLNVVLDLVFVLWLGMGVEGVAWATVIAQGVSALLVVITLLHTSADVQLFPRQLRLHTDLLGQIVRIGTPTALQMALTSFSNVFVQSYINVFGSDCMGGWTTFIKFDQFIILPIKSLGLAATTFVGQNLGAGQPQRAKQGVRTALSMALGISVFVAAVVLLFAPQLAAIFNDKPEVVAYGSIFLRCFTPCLTLCCVQNVYAGALRGAGNSRPPMLIILFSYVAFRQMYCFVMSNFISNTPLAVASGYPAGWLAACVLLLVYYHHTDLEKTAVVSRKKTD